MSKEALLAKEEAHWSSLRTAVVGLQETLVTQSSVPPEIGDGSSQDNLQSENIGMRKHSNADSAPLSASASDVNNLETKPQSTLESARDDHTKPQDRSKPEDGLGTCSQWDGTNSETDQIHQRLELIGLEGLNSSDHDKNDYVDKGLLSPGNASLQTAQTNSALSIAEQQLAETRLKLAMAESERDELEFQLMQNS